jgi:hypothetical protein
MNGASILSQKKYMLIRDSTTIITNLDGDIVKHYSPAEIELAQPVSNGSNQVQSPQWRWFRRAGPNFL